MRVPPAAIVFSDDDIAEVLTLIESSLRSGQLTLGQHGRKFEESFGQRVGRKHAIAVSSGTSALEIVFRSLDVAGKEVIVPDNTFFATAAAVMHAGGTPVFADVGRDTLAPSLEDIVARIGPNTVGVVMVHIGGIVPPQLPSIEAECKRRGIWLVCDAAHAQGATLGGADASEWGIAATYSFYPTKVMTSGEGGMIVTDDDAIAELAAVYRDQGKASFSSNFHTQLGANWRLSEVHAAIGIVQLKRLDEFIDRRRVIASIFTERLRKSGLLGLPGAQVAAESNFYKFVAYLPDGVERKSLKQELREHFDIGLSGEVYELPLHQQPVFAGLARGEYPGAEAVCGRQVCLPVTARMTADDAHYVVDSLEQVLARKAVLV